MWHTQIATRTYVSPVVYEEKTRFLTSEERPVVVVDGPREGTQFYRIITERETCISRLSDVSMIRIREAFPGTSPEGETGYEAGAYGESGIGENDDRFPPPGAPNGFWT